MENNSKVLGILVCAKNDEVEKVFYEWCKHFLDENTSHGILFVTGTKVSRETIEQLLKENPGIPFAFCGHGREADGGLLGYNDIIIDHDNKFLLEDRKSFSCACNSVTLFAHTKDYNMDFYFIAYKAKPLVPLNKNDNKLQKCFRYPNNVALQKIFNSNFNVKDLYESMVKEYDDRITELWNGGNQYRPLAIFLQDNMNQLDYAPK